MKNNEIFSSTWGLNICKRLWIFSFAKNIGKKISKSLSGKYSQRTLDQAKQSTTYAIKIYSKRVIQKAAEATGDLIGNKIVNTITKVSENSQQSNSKTVTNEHDKEIPKERYVSPDEKQKIIDELR